MKIQTLQISTVEIPMRFSVRHSLAERSTARNVLVCAIAEDGSKGFGECCPRPYVTGETVESVISDLRDTILPGLLGRQIDSMHDAKELLLPLLMERERNQLAAFCAAELAILDLAGRSLGWSAGEILGPVRAREVHYSGVVATESLEEVEQAVGFMKQFGVRQVKVKVGASLQSNEKILSLTREILGPGVQLRIDANCAWDSDEAIRQLDALRSFELAGVEQPVPGEDLAAMTAVTAAGITPVVADESLCSLDDAKALVEHQACDVFNLRVSKCGGLINTGRIHAVAQEAGLSCQLGAQVGETGILSAAGRHVATRLDGLLWLEGSYGHMLLETDIVEPDITVGPAGSTPALETPGLGVVPTKASLEQYETSTIRI